MCLPTLGDIAIGVPPTQTLWGGHVPPVPNGLTPMAEMQQNVGLYLRHSLQLRLVDLYYEA